MKTIKGLSVALTGLLVVLMTSCGPSYLSTGVGYGPRPYYGGSYGYNRPSVVIAPPVVVRSPYYAPPRAYTNRYARGGYGNGNYNRGGRLFGRRY